VLLDECLPKRFARALDGHDVWTVPQVGWAGLKNGALLSRIDGAFDAFLTVDANLPGQHDLAGVSFFVVVLRARSNTLNALLPLAAPVMDALASGRTGQVMVVGGV
jgi:hypothetical protein